jgi:hypothetical protein
MFFALSINVSVLPFFKKETWPVSWLFWKEGLITCYLKMWWALAFSYCSWGYFGMLFSTEKDWHKRPAHLTISFFRGKPLDIFYLWYVKVAIYAPPLNTTLPGLAGWMWPASATAQSVTWVLSPCFKSVECTWIHVWYMPVYVQRPL